MGCNCGGSTRQTQQRLSNRELAARRAGTSLDPSGGYYFTGEPAPPPKAKTPAKAK